LALLLVHPFKVHVGEVCLQFFGKLEAVIVNCEFGALHGEAGQDEALSIFLDLSVGEVDLELQLKLFQRPVVVLSNCLPRGGQICVRIEEATVPQTTLTEVLLPAKLFELFYALDKVVDPNSRRNVWHSVLTPLSWDHVGMQLFC
jgi:hypothetical protein